MDKNQALQNIIEHELTFEFAKSGGHGGQNVNKRETKAELFFDIDDCKYLNENQKRRLIEKAHNNIHNHHEHSHNILLMTCQEERYQHANKEKVIHHFRQLLEEIRNEPIPRINTEIPFHQKHKRKEDKIHHSKKKQNRQETSTTSQEITQ